MTEPNQGCTHVYADQIKANFGDVACVEMPEGLSSRKLVQIIRTVSHVLGVTPDDIVGPRRSRRYARPRQIVMFLSRDMCPHLSLPSIGRILGGRDHTTIIHGIRQVEALLDKDPDFRVEFQKVLDALQTEKPPAERGA